VVAPAPLPPSAEDSALDRALDEELNKRDSI